MNFTGVIFHPIRSRSLDAQAEECGAQVYFDGLQSDDKQTQYLAINKLAQYLGDGTVSQKAIREITPFLQSEDAKLARAAKSSILNGTFDDPNIVTMADGSGSEELVESARILVGARKGYIDGENYSSADNLKWLDENALTFKVSLSYPNTEIIESGQATYRLDTGGAYGGGIIMFDTPHFVQSGDARIAYYEYGAGAPLVLLHGNGEDSAYFAAQMEVFARCFRVVAVDARGHGKSDFGKGRLSFDRSADDLQTVLDALGIRKAHILGFSDGGNLAIKFALRYPDMVNRLVLNGANVRMLLGVRARDQLGVYPAVAVLSLLAPFSDAARQKREVLCLMTRGYGVTFPDLARLQAPTLVLVGENDMIRRAETNRILRSLPHAALCVIAGADHFCAAGAPNRFNAAVLKFLR